MILLVAAAVALALWCVLLTFIVAKQADTIAILKGRSELDEQLWRDQLGLNQAYEESITHLEDRPWPGRN